MAIKNTPQALILFIGDIIVLIFSLWMALFIRRLSIPNWETFYDHLIPFSYIFAIWLLVYFIYDLYRKQTSLFNQHLLTVLFNAQVVNSGLAILFFYLLPYFNITPKTNMFILLFTSFGLLVLWRIYLAKIIFRSLNETILFACQGAAIDELMNQFSLNHRHQVSHCAVLDETNWIKGRYPKTALIAISGYGRQSTTALADFYSMIFSGVRFVKVEDLYEDLFGRVPLSLISERWFLEHVSVHPKPLYDFLKRFLDLIVALIFGVLSLVFYPFIYLAIKLSDGEPIFFAQERVGRGGQVFKIYKFRTMRDGRVTKVGFWLRRTRLDELPQLWSVLKGDMSLVGPRPELPEYVLKYKENIPYYDIRHLIAPGLSGWAQIYQTNDPHFTPETETTREKLSYDLYYIKNRNLILDLTIILKTIRILLSQRGR